MKVKMKEMLAKEHFCALFIPNFRFSQNFQLFSEFVNCDVKTSTVI